jgi:uncharacterized protein
MLFTLHLRMQVRMRSNRPRKLCARVTAVCQENLMTTSSAEPAFGPVRSEERVAIIDVLRGFALLGIAIVNMSWFCVPNNVQAIEPRMFPALYDRATEFFIQMVFAGKANSIFSFLFGLGLTIQMQRAEAMGQDITQMYLRRLIVLFIAGVLHAVFLWHGDVLHDYAVIGLLLLALRRASNRWILGVLAFCFLFPLARGLVSLVIQEQAPIPVSEVVARAHDDLRIFQQGTYWEQVGARLDQLRIMHIVTALTVPGEPIFAMQLTTTVLLGLYAGREKLLFNIEALLPQIRKLTFWTFGLGLICAIGASICTLLQKPSERATFEESMGNILINLNRPLLGIAYIGFIALLLQRSRARSILRIFAPAGSMPLTNYVMQSVIATTLFYSYGFALFGRVGPLLGLGVSVAIFAVQAAYSSWWIARFQHGPLEWLWRYASYGERPPMRRPERVMQGAT